MVIVKTNKGEFKYENYQWNLAWFTVFIIGFILGLIIN